MRGWNRSRAAFVVVLLVVLVVPSALTRAADEGVLSVGKDKLTTDIKSPDDVDVFTLELLEGTTLNVVVKAGKKNGLLPTVSVFRPDGSKFDESLFAKKVGTKKPGLKKLPIDAGSGGVWALRIGSTDGQTGDYVISFKLKVPKKVKARGLPVGAGEKVRVAFGAKNGALVTVKVKEKDKKTGTPLSTVRLFDPFDLEITDATAAFLRKKTTLSLKKFPLDRGYGSYAVEVEGGPEGGNIVDVSVSVKFPKYKGRKEVLPPEAVLEKLSVETIKQEQEQVTVQLSGANFLAGAKARLDGEGLTIRSFEVTGPDTATLVFDAAEDAPFGERSLTFVPPVLFGEAQTLSGAIRVNAPDPVVTGSYNATVKQADQRVVIEVYGDKFRPGGNVGISGEGITVTRTEVLGPDLARATIDVALYATIGSRDITFTQPEAGGGASATGVGLMTVHHPNPVLMEISPNVIRQQDAGLVLTVTGQHFREGGTITGGTGVTIENVELVTADQLLVTVTVSSYAQYGGRIVTYTQPAEGGSAQAKLLEGYVVHAPIPVVGTFSPGLIKQGEANRKFMLTGDKFRTGGIVSFEHGGIETVTKVISAKEVEVTLTADLSAKVGLSDLTFTQSEAAGAASDTGKDMLEIHYPDPILTGIAPPIIRQEESGTLTLSGQHFRAGGKVTTTAAGVTLSEPTWLSNSEFRVNFTVDVDSEYGKFDLTYAQPSGGGGATDTLTNGLTVYLPIPEIDSVSPAIIVQGNGASVTVRGSKFRDGGVLTISGAGLSITGQTFVGTTEYKLTVDVDLHAKLGGRDVTYTQPLQGGGEAGTLTGGLKIHAPPPTVTGISPGTIHQADANASYTVTGTNFRDDAVITISGSGVSAGAVTVISDNTLTVLLSATESTAIGARGLTYAQPAYGGGASDTIADILTVIYPIPVITSVKPNGIRRNDTGRFVVTGQHFRSGGTLTTNATNVTLSNPKFVNSTTFEADFSVANATNTGSKHLTFTQPAVGGGESFTKENVYTVYPEIKLTSLTPKRWVPAAKFFSVKVVGEGYTPDTTISVSGTGVSVSETKVVDENTMVSVLSLWSTTTLGKRDVTVIPASGYGPSKTFTDVALVVPADPIVTGIDKAFLPQGTSSANVTIIGRNFRSGPKLIVSGSGVTFASVTVVDTETITAKVTVTSSAATGARDLTVHHGEADGAGSGTLTGAITVIAATPAIGAAVPNAIGRTGSGGPTRNVPVIFMGMNFMPGATISVTKSSGSGLSVVTGSEVVVSDSRIDAVLSVTGTATTGPWDVKVTNPTAGGGKSSTTNGVIQIQSETTLAVNRVLPDQGDAHGGDRVTIHGSGFAAGDVVDFGSQRGYATQVIDRNTIVTTVPQPVSTSTTGPTRVNVTVTDTSANSAQFFEGFAYAKDELTYFTVVKEVPAQSATAVKRNLRSACIKLSAPIDTTSVSYGFTQASQVNWGESGGYGVSGGIHGFGPQKRWLVYSRTSTGNLAIDNLGTYVLNIPTAMKSVGGVNFVVNRVASGTFDQRTFGISSTALDTTNPTLSSITPSNNATGRLTTTAIKLVFSEEIDPRTITTSNIALLSGTTPVGAAIRVDDDLKTVHLVPHTELKASTTYTVSVGVGVADLSGLPFTAKIYSFATNNGTDTTKPTVDLVIVEAVPASLDGSGQYVDVNGKSGNGFDLFMPRDGFLIRVEFSDQGGAGIDISKFSAKCSRAIGSTAANTELRSKFTITQTFAEWRIPSSSTISAADNVTFDITVTDLSNNKSASHQIKVDVLSRTTTTAGSGKGDLDPFPGRHTWLLRFGMDKYTHTFSTQSSPAKQGVTTTVSSNQKGDFAEALQIVGLASTKMTTASQLTTNGNEVGTNDIARRLIRERIREVLRMRFGVDEDGTHGPDAVDIEFLLPGEQGSLSSLPAISTSPTSNSTQGFSELSFGGTSGAETSAYTAGTTNGASYYDDRNASHQTVINTDGKVGIFASTMLKREVNGFSSRPFFLCISAKFVAIHGGTPVGEHASDDDVLTDTFDRSTSTNTTHNARYDDIMDAVELVSLYLSATAAHEIGHSVGVVADGAPKTGQFGSAHYLNTFTDATSTNTNTSGHLSLAGRNNLMATGSNFSLMSRTGTEFQRFAPHVMGYLLRRVIYDEGR